MALFPPIPDASQVRTLRCQIARLQSDTVGGPQSEDDISDRALDQFDVDAAHYVSIQIYNAREQYPNIQGRYPWTALSDFLLNPNLVGLANNIDGLTALFYGAAQLMHIPNFCPSFSATVPGLWPPSTVPPPPDEPPPPPTPPIVLTPPRSRVFAYALLGGAGLALVGGLVASRSKPGLGAGERVVGKPRVIVIEGQQWRVERKRFWSPDRGGGRTSSAWDFTRVSDGRVMTSDNKERGIATITRRIRDGEYPPKA